MIFGGFKKDKYIVFIYDLDFLGKEENVFNSYCYQNCDNVQCCNYASIRPTTVINRF